MTTKEKAEKRIQEELEEYRVSEAKRLIERIKSLKEDLEYAKKKLDNIDGLELPKYEDGCTTTTTAINYV